MKSAGSLKLWALLESNSVLFVGRDAGHFRRPDAGALGVFPDHDLERVGERRMPAGSILLANVSTLQAYIQPWRDGLGLRARHGAHWTYRKRVPNCKPPCVKAQLYCLPPALQPQNQLSPPLQHTAGAAIHRAGPNAHRLSVLALAAARLLCERSVDVAVQSALHDCPLQGQTSAVPWRPNVASAQTTMQREHWVTPEGVKRPCALRGLTRR